MLCSPTGVGKSWLASALGHRACRDNRSVLYPRVPKLFAELALARADGRHRRLIRGLISPQLLILDHWGLEPLDAGGRHDLLEILEDRYGRRSTIITSQVPIEHWHQLIGDPTYADSILRACVESEPLASRWLDRERRRRATRKQATEPQDWATSNRNGGGIGSECLGNIIGIRTLEKVERSGTAASRLSRRCSRRESRIPRASGASQCTA